MKTKNINRDPSIIIGLRLLMGGLFMVASLEGVIGWLPTNIVPESADSYLRELTGGGALMYLIRSVQLLAGGMIAFNFFVPLALMILAPVVGNIMIYSLVVNQANLPLAIAVLCGVIALAAFYAPIFKVFFKMQLYSSNFQDKTCDILIIEELEEKFPEKAELAREIYRQTS